MIQSFIILNTLLIMGLYVWIIYLIKKHGHDYSEEKK